jgi:hypothetical protein
MVDFDQDGLITPEALAQLLETEKLEQRAAESHLHNMDTAQILELGDLIAQHCLKCVSTKRALIEHEAALNVDIGEFLKDLGFSIQKLDSRGQPYDRFVKNAVQTASALSKLAHAPTVHSDLVVNSRGDRIELKTAAYATSKDRVPDSFFDKDLAHLERPIHDDSERHPFEGLGRAERRTDMALFVADMNIAKRSKRLRKIFGEIVGDTKITGATDTGITYNIYFGRYATSQVLVLNGKKNFQNQSVYRSPCIPITAALKAGETT